MLISHFGVRRFYSYIQQPYFTLLVISLIGLGLRLINISAQDFWGDEIYALSIVRHFSRFQDLLEFLKFADAYPPLYYWFLYIIAHNFGYANWVLRILPLLFGVATIPLVYICAKSFFNQRTALLSAFFTALLPINVHFSQVIRPYIIYSFIALFCLLCYWNYFQNHNKRWLFFYILSSIIGLYLHYSFLLFLIPLSAVWFFQIIYYRSTNFSRYFVIWLVTHASIALAFLYWLPFFLYKFWGLGQYSFYGYARGGFPIMRPFDVVTTTIDQLIWFNKHQIVNLVSLVAVWIFKIFFIIAVGWELLHFTGQTKQWIKDRAFPLLLLLWLIFSSMAFYFITPLSIPYTPAPEQPILYVSILIVILLAAIIDQMPIRLFILLSVLYVVSLTTFLWAVVENDAWSDPSYTTRDNVEFINNNYQPGDLVVVGNVITRTDFNYYLRPDTESVPFYPIPFLAQDEFSTRDTLGIVENEFHFRIAPISQKEAFLKFDMLMKKYKPKRVWLAYFPWRWYADHWFDKHGWHKKFSSNHPLLPVDLWESPSLKKK